MKTIGVSVLTICGIDELPEHGTRAVTHVLSLLDPTLPELTSFGAYGAHHRTVLRFHDIIDPDPGMIMPAPDHVSQILAFGSGLAAEAEQHDRHLLVHCHMGVSRSTAAMLTLMAQVNPGESEDQLFERLRSIRPQAWPNSLMIGFADDQLGREGRLVAALRRHYGHQVRAKPQFREWMTQLRRTRELEMAE